ncbi:MAG: S8 family peptidase [Muribaculaceae bacterium]|nr:S8 family peptidase [Muribaculaceae bacterium]
MKKITFLILSTLAVSAVAQNKIDPAGRFAIENYRFEQQSGAIAQPGTNPLAANARVEPTYNVIVEFDENGIDFGNEEIEIMSNIGNSAIVSLTPDQMERVAELPGVLRISLGFENKPLMKAARAATFVDEVQNGTGLGGVQYTGKGVIASLFDTGLDVNHINFLTADGQPRTKSLWVYKSNSGAPIQYTDPVSISNFTSETTTESHATHVLGIMAGSYKGPAEYAELGSNGRANIVKQDAQGSAMPYYGVATDAELALACGPLSDANILNGVDNIVKYAKAQKKPCVVNLSLGNTIGPHDGTDAFSRSLATLGKDAIIFISAGNSGTDNLSFETTSKAVKTFIGNDNYTTGSANGIVDLWGSDNQVFDVRVFVYDRATSRDVFTYTLDANLAGKSVAQGDMSGFSSSGFSGTLRMSSNVDPINNRYNVTINLNLSTGQTSRLFGIEVTPKQGQTINGFANNMVFMSQSQPGFINGNPDNSINGMACGENVIAVGSFCTARSFPVLSGSAISYTGGAAVGSISNFSSYGYTPSGRTLPVVCAPGEVVISSVNKYNVDAENLGNGQLSGRYEMPGDGLFVRTSSWQAMQGTSMASPFAAGVVATWLQAKPDMTVNEVIEIIELTATTDLMIEEEKYRWGAGKINALAGIKEVLSRSTVMDVAADVDNAIITTADGHTFEVFVAGVNNIETRIYDLSGNCVASEKADGNKVTVNADHVAPGVYVFKVTTPNNTETRKVILR